MSVRFQGCVLSCVKTPKVPTNVIACLATSWRISMYARLKVCGCVCECVCCEYVCMCCEYVCTFECMSVCVCVWKISKVSQSLDRPCCLTSLQEAKRILGIYLLRLQYMLPQWDRSCRPNLLFYSLIENLHWASKSLHWPYNARHLCGIATREQFFKSVE